MEHEGLEGIDHDHDLLLFFVAGMYMYVTLQSLLDFIPFFAASSVPKMVAAVQGYKFGNLHPRDFGSFQMILCLLLVYTHRFTP